VQILKQAGVRLGENYPVPIVQLDVSRSKALAAYKNL
jgi:deoxyribodipyrimidine photolyase